MAGAYITWNMSDQIVGAQRRRVLIDTTGKWGISETGKSLMQGNLPEIYKDDPS